MPSSEVEVDLQQCINNSISKELGSMHDASSNNSRNSMKIDSATVAIINMIQVRQLVESNINNLHLTTRGRSH